LAKTPAVMGRSVGGVVQAAEELTGLDAGLGKTAAEFWGERAKPYDLAVTPGSAKSYVGQAVESVAQNAPGLLLGALTANPAIPLATMAAQSAGGQYATLREKQVSPAESALAAAGYGAAEAITERLPVAALLKPGSTLLARILKSTALDIPGEELTALIQAGIDKGTLSPEMSWGDVKQRLIDTGLVTAIAAPAMAAATHPAVRARERAEVVRPSESSNVIARNLPGPEMRQETDTAEIPPPPPGFVIEEPFYPTAPEGEPVAAADYKTPNVAPTIVEPKRPGPKLAVLGDAPDLLNTIDLLPGPGGLRLTELRTAPSPTFRNGGLLAYRDRGGALNVVGDDSKLRQFGPRKEVEGPTLLSGMGGPPGFLSKDQAGAGRSLREIERTLAPEPGYRQQGLEFTGEPLEVREQMGLFGPEPAPVEPERAESRKRATVSPPIVGLSETSQARSAFEQAKAEGRTWLVLHNGKPLYEAPSYEAAKAMKPAGKEYQVVKAEPAPEPAVSSMGDLARAMADAGERSRGEAANEMVGKLGMKAAGPLKSAGSLEGSPLFGSSQKGLFGDERGALNLEGLAPPRQVDYSGIDDAKPRAGPGLVERTKERTASWLDRTIRRTTDRFVDLRRLVERAEAQNLLRDNPDFQRWNQIDQEIVAVEQEIGDLEGSSRAVTRRGGMREQTSIPLTRADADRLATLRSERLRLQTESERLGKRISGNRFQKLAREVAARRSAAKLSADVDPAKQAQIAYGGGLGRAQLGMMDYGDVVKDARKEGMEDGLRVYLRLAAKERGISVVEEKLADRKKTMTELRPKLGDLNGQIRGLEADLKTRRHVQNVPTVERRVTRNNEVKLEALKKFRNDVEANLRKASFEADRFQRLLDQRQAVPDNDTHQTLAAKQEQLRARAPEKFAAIETAAKRVFALNRKALELAYDEGLISEEAYNKWTARGDAYVPLTRLIEEASIDHGEGEKPGTFQAKQQFQPLEGGSRELEDPVRASMDRFQSIVKQVEKNRVVKNIVTWMSQHPDLAEARQLDKGDGGHPEKPGAQEGELAFYFDGELQRFAVDKTLADVLTMSPPHIADFTGGALIGFASRVAKAGITGVNLAFSVPNVVRDVKTLAMTSKAGVRNPLKHPGDLGRIVKLWVESLVSQSNQDPHFREFLESGAAFSTLQSNLTPEYFTRMKRTTNFNPLYWAAQVNQKMEQATKLASFRLGRERGMSGAEAAWETRTFGGSPDFGKRGTQGAVWNALFLYFNARVQGTLQSVQGGTRDPMRLGYMLAAYTAAALALQAWNNGFEDEEGNKEFDRVTDQERQQYQVILLPGTEQKADGSVRHQAVKIPKSHFEQLWFNPVQETIARLFGGKVDLAQTGLDFASNLTPISGQIRRGSVARDVVFGGVSSLNPLLKEGIEQFSNFDTYRKRPLVPERLKRVDPRYQYNATTSEAAKRAGKVTGVSPLRLEHAARSFGGGTAEALLSTGDLFLKDTARQPVEGQERLTRLPLVGAILRRFIGTSGDAVQQRRADGFYAMKAQADQVQATYRDRAKANPAEARRYLDEDPSHRKLLSPAVRKRINSMGEALSRIHTQARQVAESRLPDAAKKQKARELDKLEGNVLAQAERLAKQLGVGR